MQKQGFPRCGCEAGKNHANALLCGFSIGSIYFWSHNFAGIKLEKPGSHYQSIKKKKTCRRAFPHVGRMPSAPGDPTQIVYNTKREGPTCKSLQSKRNDGHNTAIINNGIGQ